MSGHSKWSTIKHQKGVADVRRGALFTKLARGITLAVRQGSSGDPDMNFKLRLAIDKAKGSNMPSDNISRTIKKAIGEGTGGENLEEIVYEGYGPGGAAILLQAVTSNRNRTAGEIRSTFNRGGGNLGEAGCVSWNFENKGVITAEIANEARAEELGLLAIDAEADDVNVADGILEIYTAPDKLLAVGKALEAAGVTIASSEVSLVPKTTILLDFKTAEQTLKLLDHLEELDDVLKASTNADFPPEVLEQYRAAA